MKPKKYSLDLKDRQICALLRNSVLLRNSCWRGCENILPDSMFLQYHNEVSDEELNSIYNPVQDFIEERTEGMSD